MTINKEFSLFILIGNLISCYKKQKLNDVDLYNSIIRLIYTTADEDKSQFKKIVDWLDDQEIRMVPGQEQYNLENVKNNAGNDYLEGLVRIAYVDKDLN